MASLQELFERFGVVIVFLNTLLHELALPIPLTPTVLVAGAANSRVIAFISLVAAIVAGSLIGNAVWFAAGRRFGARVLGLLCRFSLSPDTCVAKSADGFGRWGAAFLIIGRFLPGVSLLAPPVAGALGMKWPKFLALTALGSAFWAVVVILLGAALQEAILAFVRALAVVPAGLWLATAALIAAYVLWRYRRRQAARLDVPRISPAELRSAMLSAAPPMVIDVRGATMRQMVSQRIPGALTVPLADLPIIPLARPAVLYCNCPGEASAAEGVRILRSHGHADARALRGGLAAWIAAGYEVETSAPEALKGAHQPTISTGAVKV